MEFRWCQMIDLFSSINKLSILSKRDQVFHLGKQRQCLQLTWTQKHNLKQEWTEISKSTGNCCFVLEYNHFKGIMIAGGGGGDYDIMARVGVFFILLISDFHGELYWWSEHQIVDNCEHSLTKIRLKLWKLVHIKNKERMKNLLYHPCALHWCHETCAIKNSKQRFKFFTLPLYQSVVLHKIKSVIVSC